MHHTQLLPTFALLLLAASPLAHAFRPPAVYQTAPAESHRAYSSSLAVSSTDNAVANVQPETTAAVPSPPPVQVRIDSLPSLDGFLQYIDEAPRDSLVVVKFYGKSCPLCKRVALKYKKLARYYSTAPMQFAEIDKTAHPGLFETLQVTTFPYLQIYRNGHCVASHGTQTAQMFERIINDSIHRFLSMTPEQWDSFLTAFAEPIRQSTENLQRLRSMRSDGTNTSNKEG